MFVKLASGEARIGVAHTKNESLLTKGPDGKPVQFIDLRGTRVKLTLPDGTDLEARSVCKPPDQFCKSEGRRFAANHLLSMVRSKLPKNDRKEIFKAICPEYFHQSR